MNRFLAMTRLCASLAIVSVAGLWAHTASSGQDYGRMKFTFDEQTRLKASVSGTTATLNFTRPVTQSPASIKASLPEYVQAVSLSDDRKQVVLKLKDSYRIRQFVSGNNVGIDLIGQSNAPAIKVARAPNPATLAPSAEPTRITPEHSPSPLSVPEDLSAPAGAEPYSFDAAADAAEHDDNVLTTKTTAAPKKPETVSITTTKPIAKPPTLAIKTAVPEKAAPAKKEAPAVIAKRKPDATKSSAKLPVETAATVTAHEEKHTEHSTTKPETVATPIAAPAEHTDTAILTTKAAEPLPAQAAAAPAAQEPVAATPAAPAPEAHPEPDTDVDTTVHEPKPETAHESVESAPTDPAPAQVTPPEAPATQTVVVTNEPAGPFTVTARSSNGETVINFPWRSRTATAVFERAQDIWVIFSHPKDVNSALLRTIMPKEIINVMQYAYAGNTVIRLVTDGSIHARADQAKGGYGWNITLSKTASKPSLDVAIAPDSIDGTTRMNLAIFDVSTTLRFFDPNAGDEFIIIPSFENSRGVSAERNFAEFDLLASPQGVAIVNRRPDMTTNQTRAGFMLGGTRSLALSPDLPMLAGDAPIAGASANSGVMIPYDQWYVPRERINDTILGRIHSIAAATKAAKADAMLELAKLYLAEGFGAEATGLLTLIKEQYPQYYVEKKLALLSAAAHVMDNKITDAATDLLAPELNDLEEATMWREVVNLYAPPPSTAQAIAQSLNPNSDSAANVSLLAPEAGGEHETTADHPPEMVAPTALPEAAPAHYEKPIFHYLKYNKPFIRFYPPRMRLRLADIAADAYIDDGQEEKALATYDTLMRDGILEAVSTHAEFALGAVARKKGEIDQALEIFDRLSKQVTDPYTAARARHAAAMLRYNKGKATGEDAAEILESTRMAWRGDALERQILKDLIGIYTDAKQYDNILRAQKALLDGFPNAPDALTLSGEMGDLFHRVFNEGLADEMPPLKALSLFYEFRDLTPLGEKGDQIIQRLADRLAAIDLLDRATQLLEHQIKFRVTAEQRSQVGARLALLHLLNSHPQEALNVLEVTNYGNNSPDLNTQRHQLTAEALTRLGKNEEALGVLYNDTTPVGARLRLDVLWAMQDWPNVVNHAEEILSTRTNLTEPLTLDETEVLLKLALGYSFEGDYVQLRYLRDYYGELIPNTAYKQIFDFITNDTTPLDPEDFAMLAKQISRTENFLSTFKAKIAAGKLSETIQ